MRMMDRVIECLADALTYDNLNDLYSVVDDDPQEFCEKLHEILSEMEKSEEVETISNPTNAIVAEFFDLFEINLKSYITRKLKETKR